MRLQSFEVAKYRNVVRSGRVEVESDVTCLVGKNEAGKSAILGALHKANPSGSASFDVHDEYPRWLLVGDRRRGDLDQVRPIHATFELDDDDRAAIAELVGEGVVTATTIALERTYAGTAVWTVEPADEGRAVENLLARADAGVPFEATTFVALRTELARARQSAPAELAERLRQVGQAVDELLGGRTLDALVRDALVARAPVFFYFDDYSVLPGRVDLEMLSGDGGAASNGLRTARALLRLAGTEGELLATDDYETRRAELEAVSNELTRQVFEYWTQSSELDVSIDVDTQSVAQANGETTIARYLDVRVHDKRHGYTGNFAHRSSGFQWFFSFLAAFSELGASDQPVIILLDEPALGLHARAQHDFLRFINERLAERSQVIYTTHSPFMIETDRLERVRVVEDHGPQTGATVSADPLAAERDSTLPIVAALSSALAERLHDAGAPGSNGTIAETLFSQLGGPRAAPATTADAEPDPEPESDAPTPRPAPARHVGEDGDDEVAVKW